jgi:hypothetical protein
MIARAHLVTSLAAAYLFAAPPLVMAQAAAKPTRFTIAVSGGVQQAADEVSDHFSFPKNVETETVDVTYPMKPWALIDLAAGYRVWKNVGVGVAVSVTSGKGDARSRPVSRILSFQPAQNRDRH